MDALAEWSADVARAIQQHQQQSSIQPPAQLQNAAAVLHESSIWLPAAADFLLLCMQHADLWSAADRRRLLDILGQLVRHVLRVLYDSAKVRYCLLAQVYNAWILEFFALQWPVICLGQMPSVLCCHEHRHGNGPLCAAPTAQVVACVPCEERAAAAGLWPPKPSHLSIAACMGQLHDIAAIARDHIGELLHLLLRCLTLKCPCTP